MAGNRQLRWRIVYDALLKAIDQGELPPKHRLPTEKELAKRYAVSRDSVRTALGRLEAEGLITEANGPMGREVREYAPLFWHLSRFELGERRDDPDTGTDEWAADMKAQGREPTQVVSVDRLPAPAAIAKQLGVRVRTVLVRRRRLRLANGVPVSVADTWVTRKTANRTCMVGDQRVRPFWYPTDLAVEGGIVAAIGYIQDHADDTIYVRNATREEADLLEISAANTSVGQHVRVGYDADHRPIRVLSTVFPGSRLALKYRLKFRNNEGNVQ
jgi:GntR family transcriptional regulator